MSRLGRWLDDLLWMDDRDYVAAVVAGWWVVILIVLTVNGGA